MLVPVGSKSQAAQLKELAAWGPDRAVAAIRYSIKREWRGIFEPKAEGNAAGGRPLFDQQDPRGNLALAQRLLDAAAKDQDTNHAA